MFKVNNKDVRASFWYLYWKLWAYFSPWSSVSIVNFKQVKCSISEKSLHRVFQFSRYKFQLYYWEQIDRSSLRRCSLKNVFLKISQKLYGSSCVGVSFLIKLTLLLKELGHRCFSVNFETILRTPFLQNTFGRLLLNRLVLGTLSSAKTFHLNIRILKKFFDKIV